MNQAQDLVQQTFQSDFDRQQFSKFIDRLLKNANFSKQFSQSGGNVRQAFRDKVSSFERIAQFTDVDGNKIDVLIVNLKRDSTIERGRTSLRNFAADYLQSDRGLGKAAVLVAYVSESKRDWRFSYVTLEKSLVKAESGKFKEAVERLTPARRFSFLVGSVEQKTHTAQKQFFNLLQSQSVPTLKQIEEAFSIEKVTKDFYEEYEKLFRRVEKEIESLRRRDAALNKNLKESFIESADFAKKLLGQIVFLYFLQKKGWFGVERGEAWGSGRKDFLRYLFEHRAKLGTRQERGARQGVNFFNDILEHLFYDALARERDEDYYARFDCKIPFLNGGLFEAAYSWTATDVLLPDALFSNTDLTKEGDKGTGILDVFDRYNFTVNEAEPLEKDVAVDPEMLGKVFENLLPENERKGKGSFYTPRPIVNYMCQQSLVSYLATHLTDAPREDIETFIRIGDFQSDYDAAGTKKYEDNFLPESISRNAARIDELLRDITVCDPAIGSGAFPVGMMQEIVRARGSLTNRLDDAKPNKTAGERESFARARSAYELKRHAIQTSLYGVDIDPGAIEIAKLRLWLSLVVDEDERERVEALPNLDYKIMQGNALLDEFAGVKLIDDAMFEKPAFDIEAERRAIQQRIGELTQQLYALHGKANDAEKLKRKFGKEIENLLGQSKALTQPEAAAENLLLLSDDPYREARSTLDEIRRKIDEFFSLTSPREKREMREQIEKLEWRFMQQTLKTRDEENALVDLAFRERDNRKPYFLWKLYFSDVFQSKGGFDVVIANPPYVRQEEIKEFKPALKRKYQTFTGTADLYVYFYECALNLLNGQGSLSFISSNKYFRAGYGERLRGLLSANTTIQQLIDFGDAPVFEATAYASIIVLQKGQEFGVTPSGVSPSEAADLTYRDVTLNETRVWTFPQNEKVENFEEGFNRLGFNLSQAELRAGGWRLERPDVLRLLEELRERGTPFGEYVGGKFYRGILTGLNEAFVVGRATRDVLIAEHSSSAEVLKPFLRGRDVKRWQLNYADLYLIKIESSENKKHAWTGKNDKEAEKIFAAAYPAIYNRFQTFREALIERDDQGKFFWELRSCIYWKEFEKPKILYQEIATYQAFAFDRSEAYSNNKTFIVPYNDSWLLGFLNSKSAWWFLHQVCSKLQGGALAMQTPYVSQLPIPTATPEQQTIIAAFVDYILFLKANSLRVTPSGVNSSRTAKLTPEGVTLNDDTLITDYFERIIDALVYELYLTDELHAANLHFFRSLAAEQLPPLRDRTGGERKVIQKIFERPSARDHRIERNLHSLNELESVRVIEGKA